MSRDFKMKKQVKSTSPNKFSSAGSKGKKRDKTFVGTKIPQTITAQWISKSLIFAMCVGLVLATMVPYSQVFNHDFIAYDDDQYVYENDRVKDGFTPSNISWALTTFYYANWHPLTWLSHMADCQFFGLNPGWHHLINLLFHIFNVLLLFMVFTRATRRPWRSFIVAWIFALHPLHVESVAWISERKDVLSTTFGLLSLFFYEQFAERPTFSKYISVALSFALCLMAKPMLVTLPFVFLLADIWPLQRFKQPFSFKKNLALLGEKVPFFIMSALACVLTFDAQHSFGAVASLANLSLAERVGNATISYSLYLMKALWPVRLAVLYPIQTPPVIQVIFALGMILAISIAAVLLNKKRTYVVTGWLW